MSSSGMSDEMNHSAVPSPFTYYGISWKSSSFFLCLQNIIMKVVFPIHTIPILRTFFSKEKCLGLNVHVPIHGETYIKYIILNIYVSYI